VLERYLNSLNGFNSADDDLPERFFLEEGSSSQHLKIKPLNRQEFISARNNYYKIRGYGPDGIPGRELLLKLGLADYL
jgi:aldehyde:ferredoxin oxidoreductase